MRRWILFLAATVPLRAQAPESVSPGDARVVWERPDLQAELFDAGEVKLEAALLEAVVRDLLLVVRNLPDSAGVTMGLRSQALGVALRLDRGNPLGLIANGQYARGVRPQPLPAEDSPTAESVAGRLIATARGLLEGEANARHRLGYLLLDLARRLDPARAQEISLFTYGSTVEWPGPAAPEPPLWSAPELKIMEGRVRFLKGLERGKPVMFTVSAQAGKGKEGQKLQAVLPGALMEQMKEEKHKALKEEIEARSLAMRDMLQRRHDLWPEGWRVEFTFSADVRGGLLPQAFAGMGVVLDSMLCEEGLDARCIVAGGIDSAGVFSGGVPADEAVRAVAAAEEGSVLVLPAVATRQIEDWLLARPQQWTVLTQLTVIRAASLADVMAVAHAERAGKLAESFAAFEQVAARLRESAEPLALLRSPEVVEKLRGIVAVHPQHLSADILLRIATQTMPRYLSLAGSLKTITAVGEPLLSGDRQRFPLNVVLRPQQKSVFSAAAAELAELRARLHPKSLPCLDSLLPLAGILHQSCGKNTRYEPAAAGALRGKARAAIQAIQALAEPSGVPR